MASFSPLGIGLSFLFGCFLLGLFAELYYLLFWKKKRINNAVIEDPYSNYAQEIYHFLCWKKPNSVNDSSNQNPPSSMQNPDANGHEQEDLELGTAKDLVLLTGIGEESVESELMRLHNLCGPPRFLFTINEETKEDLESDDGKSRGDRSRKGSRTRSLSDLVLAIDTPFLTPLSSPPLKAQALDSYKHHGFNPLFESLTEAELNRLRSSPPSRFKFLRDAEEKLIRRLMEKTERRVIKNGGFVEDYSVVKAPPNQTVVKEDENGFFIGKKERGLLHQLPHYHSSSSQVLPLASSPSTFRSLDENSIVQ